MEEDSIDLQYLVGHTRELAHEKPFRIMSKSHHVRNWVVLTHLCVEYYARELGAEGVKPCQRGHQIVVPTVVKGYISKVMLISVKGLF